MFFFIFQAFLHNKNAYSIEESYDLFDFGFIVAMECDSKIDPRFSTFAEKPKNCSSSGSFYDDQTDTMFSLKVLTDLQPKVRILESMAQNKQNVLSKFM